MRSTEAAGLRCVLLPARTSVQEQRAWEVLGDGTWLLEKVDMFVDAGCGVHGIPHQARHLLYDHVLFDAGHSVCPPDHYRMLIQRKTDRNVVFSAFVPREDNPRFRTRIVGGHCREHGAGESWALAHPMVIDRVCVDQLPTHGSTVDRIAATYRDRGRLLAVPAPTPVEFDVAREHRRTLNVHAANAADCEHGLPWRGTPTATAVEITLERR